MPDYDINAYESPQFPTGSQDYSRYKAAAKSRLMVPSIALIVLSSVGAIMSLYNIVYALTSTAPNEPGMPEVVRMVEQNTVGLVAAVVQSLFLIVNVFVILGSISMLKLMSYPMAIAVSVVATINIGSCCCLPSLPFAIWAMVLLSNEEVKRGFG